MNTKTVEDAARTAIDDMGSEDCEVVSVILKRKTRLKAESFEEPQTKQTKPESNDCILVEVEESNSATKYHDSKTEVLKSDDCVLISEDIRTEVKYGQTKSNIKYHHDDIKSNIINLDHHFSHRASSADVKSDSLEIGSFGRWKKEPFSSETIKSKASGYCVPNTSAISEPFEPVECKSDVVAPEASFVSALKSESIALLDTPDNIAPIILSRRPRISELKSQMKSGAPLPDYEFTGVTRDPIEKSNSVSFLHEVCENIALDYESLENQERCSLGVDALKEQDFNAEKDVTSRGVKFSRPGPNMLSIAPFLEVDNVENSPCIRELSTVTATAAAPEAASTETAEPPVFKCDGCRKKFTDKQRLIDHCATHFSCNVCGKLFKTHSMLAKHKEKQHADVEHYCCNMCGKQVLTWSSLIIHKKSCRRHGLFTCTLCSDTFKTRLLIEDHLSDAHKIMPKESMKQFFLGAPAENNTESTESPKYQEFQLPLTSALASLVSFLRQDKLYTCNLCDQAFQHKGNMMKHQTIHNERQRQACLICEQKFDELESFKTHMTSHRGSDQCFLPEEFRRHININPGRKRSMYVCRLCGTKSPFLKSVTEHLRKHKDGYPCSRCGKEKLTKGNCKELCILPELGASHDGKLPRKSIAASIPPVTPIVEVTRPAMPNKLPSELTVPSSGESAREDEPLNSSHHSSLNEPYLHRHSGELHTGNLGTPLQIQSGELGTGHDGKLPPESTAASIRAVKPALDFLTPESGSDENAAQKVSHSQKSNTYTSHKHDKRLYEFYKCGSCCGLFQTLQEFTNHEKNLESSQCKRSSRRIYKIVIVMPVDTSSTTSSRKSMHVCECCKMNFINARELDDHYATHYAGGVFFPCNVCGVRFVQHSHLMHHKRVREHYSLAHVCKICNKSFDHALLIENHLKTVHGPMDENNMEHYISRVSGPLAVSKIPESATPLNNGN